VQQRLRQVALLHRVKTRRSTAGRYTTERLHARYTQRRWCTAAAIRRVIDAIRGRLRERTRDDSYLTWVQSRTKDP
jgi:hypothetical protein